MSYHDESFFVFKIKTLAFVLNKCVLRQVIVNSKESSVKPQFYIIFWQAILHIGLLDYKHIVTFADWNNWMALDY